MWKFNIARDAAESMREQKILELAFKKLALFHADTCYLIAQQISDTIDENIKQLLRQQEKNKQ